MAEEDIPVLNPRDFNKNFDSEAYLRDFYTSSECEHAMKVVLYFFPNLVARIPDGVKVLDVGSGPTVHVPMIFRNKVSEMWLSDYASSNRKTLRRWLKRRSTFDWGPIAQYIAGIEGFPEQWRDVESHAREKVAGVLTCNVLNKKVLKNREDFETGFDVVSTVFCLEAACSTEQQYRRGFSNICKLIRCQGLLLMGGILEERCYQFGGKRVECFFLTEKVVMECLKKAGINTTEGKNGKRVECFFLTEKVLMECLKKAGINTTEGKSGKRVECFFLTEKVLMECLKKAGINTTEGSYLYFNHQGIFIVLGRKIKQ